MRRFETKKNKFVSRKCGRDPFESEFTRLLQNISSFILCFLQVRLCGVVGGHFSLLSKGVGCMGW